VPGTVFRELDRAREASRAHRDARSARSGPPLDIVLKRTGASPEPIDGEPTPDELAARAEVQERLAAAVLALDPRQRDVLLLRHFDGASVADIARRLGLARATVHEHLERGHKELRRVLSTFDDDRRMTRLLALLVASNDSMRATLVAATAGAASPAVGLPPILFAMHVTKSIAAVTLVAALSYVGWRAVAPWRDRRRDEISGQRSSIKPPSAVRVRRCGRTASPTP